MRNIYTFFWGSLAVKVLLFAVLNFFFWGSNSFHSEKIVFYVIAALMFAIISFLKHRKARTFGKYFTLMQYEFTFMLISAMSLNDFGFGIVAAFTIIEWQLYLREFCVLKPSDKFDGDIEENE